MTMQAISAAKARVETAVGSSTFVRLAIGLAAEKGNYAKAATYAVNRWGKGSLPAQMLQRAAVTGGTTLSTGTWGDELVTDLGQAATAFFTSVNVRSIIGRLTGLRRIPIKTRTLVSTAISSGWVGEGAAKALSNPTYTKAAGLDPFKIATVVVATDELLNSSDPAAETAIREQMIRDQVVAVDSAFIDPANAGVANVKPASILSGAGVGGSSPAGPPEGDLETLIENFTGSLEDAVIVMHPALAARLSGADRPLIGVKGGTWSGFPVITSSVVPGGIVAMIDPTGIAVAMPDNLAEIRVSTQGTIEMSDGPTSSAATPTATAQVSFWQVNSVAILAERVANWRVVRSGAVAYLSGASY